MPELDGSHVGRAGAGRGLLVLLAALALGGRCLADDKPTSAPPATGGPAIGGMVIYRDPATGQLTGPPAGAPVHPRARAVVPPTPMTERLGLTPGGGVLLDGIPRMGVTVAVGANGVISSGCRREPPRGGE